MALKLSMQPQAASGRATADRELAVTTVLTQLEAKTKARKLGGGTLDV